MSTTAEKDPTLYAYRPWGGSGGWRLTLSQLRQAVALYANNQSAFAREIVKGDARRVRDWLAGGKMSHTYAERVRDFLAKPTTPSRAAYEGARNIPRRRVKGPGSA